MVRTIGEGAQWAQGTDRGKSETETLQNLNKILVKNITSVDMSYGPTIPNQVAVIVESECIGCKKCITACPVDAISG